MSVVSETEEKSSPLCHSVTIKCYVLLFRDIDVEKRERSILNTSTNWSHTEGFMKGHEEVRLD